MKNKEILAFFGTLPDLPLSRIFDYLDVRKLIVISLRLPEWKEFCSDRMQKYNKNNAYLSLTVQHDVLNIYNLMDMGSKMFSVYLKVRRKEEDVPWLRKEEENLALLIKCKNENIMEELCVKIFNMINTSSLERVNMEVNKDGKIERLNLLERMITGRSMPFSGMEDIIVDGNDLNLVVEATKEIDTLSMYGAIPSVEFNYGDNLHRFAVIDVENTDVASQQLTTEYIKKINCQSYIVLPPIHGPEQVNIFLHSWTSGGNGNVGEIELVFNKAPNEEDMLKIYEGLDAKEWDPQRREARLLIDVPKMLFSLELVDLSGAKDLIPSDGKVGTLFIERGTTVKFVVWTDRFPWRNKRESIKQRLMKCKEFLAQSDKKLVEEVDKELNEVGDFWMFTDLQCSKKSDAHKKIADKMVMKRSIEKFFRQNADYLSTFDD